MAGEDRDYVRWVRGRLCAAGGGPTDCEGPIEAHHAGDRGLSQRAHDRTAIPLCTYHHRCWHDHFGWCRGWSRDQRREWVARWIALLTLAFEHQETTPWPSL